jgi:hypothetical protein
LEDARLVKALAPLYKKASLVKGMLNTIKTQAGDWEGFVAQTHARIAFLLGLAPAPSTTGFAASSAAAVAGHDDRKRRASAADLSPPSGPAKPPLSPQSSAGNTLAVPTASPAKTSPPLSAQKSVVKTGAGAGGAPGAGKKRSMWTKAKLVTTALSTAMRVMKRLKSLLKIGKMHGDASGLSPAAAVLAEVFKFVEAPPNALSLPALRNALNAQRSRAVVRLLGLRYFETLVEAIEAGPALNEFLRHFAMAFGQAVAASGSGAPAGAPSSSNNDGEPRPNHFLSGLSAVGPTLSSVLSDGYFSVVQSLIKKDAAGAKPGGPGEPGTSGLDDTSKLYLMSMANIDLRAEDLSQIDKVMNSPGSPDPIACPVMCCADHLHAFSPAVFVSLVLDRSIFCLT